MITASLMGFSSRLLRCARADSLASRLLVGISWTTMGNMVSSAATLLGSVLLARTLGAHSYGEFGVVQSSLGFFGLLVGPALGLTATKHVAELRHTNPERLARILRLVNAITYGLALAVSLSVFLFAGWVAQHVIKEPLVAPGLRASSFALLFMALNGVQVGALCGFEAFQAVALANIGRGLATLPALWLGARYLGSSGAVWGLAFSWGLACTISGLALRKQVARHGIPARAPGFLSEGRVVLHFSMPGWAGGLIGGMANWVGLIIVARQADGMLQSGLLNAANQIFLILMFLPQIVNQAALPILSERQGAGDMAGTGVVLGRMLWVNLLVSLPLAVGFSLFSMQIMGRFGSTFRQGWPVLVVSLFSVPVYAIGMAGINLIVARGRMWLSSAIYAAYMVVFVGVNLILADWGALGFVWGRFAGFLAFILGVYLCLRKAEGPSSGGGE